MTPAALTAFSVILLEHAGRFLLLRRAAGKRVHPGRWTGIGGRVEPGELGDMHASALRELNEETGLAPDEVEGFTLRRALLRADATEGLTVLLYFTGHLRAAVTPACPEGTLHWLTPNDIGEVDVIESSRDALRLLIDETTLPPGTVKVGVYGDGRTLWL